MKKIYLIIAVLFLLTSCSEKPPEDVSNIAVEETETVDKSAIVSEAVSLFDQGKLLPALDKALEAQEYTDCQRIIASVAGAYRNGTGLLSRSLTLVGEVKAIEISEDGDFFAVSDDNTLYLIDYEKAEIVATLPNGDFWFDGDLLLVVGDSSHAYNMSGEEVMTTVEVPDDSKCEHDGKVYRLVEGKLTDGEWETEFERVEGYLNIFPLDHEMYNTDGDVVTYYSIVVANGRRITAFDRMSGQIVFDTELNDDLLTCRAGDGAVVIGTSEMLSVNGQLFSNKANSPLFPEGDMLRLSDTYKFAENRRASAYSNGRIATAAVGSNEVELLFKVSYDTHRKLSLEARYPTAIADFEGVLAVGIYEYIDGKRHDYFVEYDLSRDTYTETEISHPIDEIYYADGWQIVGDGQITALSGVVREKKQSDVTVGSVITYGDKTVTIGDDTNTLVDSEGNSVDLGFTLNAMSRVSYADSDTLFITEYTYSGKSVLVSLSDMKIKAEVENGVYFVGSANAILYIKGSKIGLYEYRGNDFSYVKKEDIK